MRNDKELLPCPFCGAKMYKGVNEYKGLIKHPLMICPLTDDGKDLWFDIELWNQRAVQPRKLVALDRNKVAHTVVMNIDAKIKDGEVFVELDKVIDAICSKFGSFNKQEALERIISVEDIEKIIHLKTFFHRKEDGKYGISYIKECNYCNDREWLKSIATKIHDAMQRALRGEKE